MIPTHIAEIADLIWPDWADLDGADLGQVLSGAERIYEAGYRKSPQGEKRE